MFGVIGFYRNSLPFSIELDGMVGTNAAHCQMAKKNTQNNNG